MQWFCFTTGNKGIATSNKKLVAPGITTRNATNVTRASAGETQTLPETEPSPAANRERPIWAPPDWAPNESEATDLAPATNPTDHVP